jgi:hypothetical protein
LLENKNINTIQETEIDMWMNIKWFAWFDCIST